MLMRADLIALRVAPDLVLLNFAVIFLVDMHLDEKTCLRHLLRRIGAASPPRLIDEQRRSGARTRVTNPDCWP
jgi:hypothetical protein